MRKEDEPLIILYILLLVFIAYSFLLKPLGFLKAFPLRANDLFAYLSRVNKPVPKEAGDIVVVGVDNASLKEVNLKWPWPRTMFADLITRISAGAPKVIYLDHAFFGKSSDEASDTALAQAIKKAGNVILAGYINEDGEYVKPMDIFASSCVAVGITNNMPDREDSLLRSMRAMLPALIGQGDYNVVLKIFALARGIPLSAIRHDSARVFIGEEGFRVQPGEWTVPINYSAGVNDFRNISASAILNSGPVDPSLFRDKIVLVGATANIIHDIHHTPLGEIPGIYVIANSLIMLFRREFINALPYWHGIFIMLLFVFGLGFLFWRLKAVYSAMILSGVSIAVSAGYLLLRSRYNFQMDIFSLVFLGMASFFTVEAYKYVSLIIESEKLKTLAITDNLTGAYTQRYFQLNVESALGKTGPRQSYLFCLVYINDFAGLSQKYSKSLPQIIKMLSDVVRECLGSKVSLARYGEDAFSLCVWNTDSRERQEKALSLLASEVSGRDFMAEDEALRISVRISAISFPREHIDNYSDLVLSCEAIIRRLQPEAGGCVAVFDPKIDRIISSASGSQTAKVMPKGELGYVSMDLAARNKELEAALEELKKQQKKIEQLYFHTMHSLVKALEEKDPYTAGHSERVGFYATELARGLNLPKEEIEAVNKAAYLHDIGKIGLPDSILHKKERLDENDFAFIKRHMADGAKILEGLPFCEQIVPYVLHHHERYDGRGYPHGLSGNMIPIGAQIICIADSFDAMTTGRGYNKPLMVEEAIEELKKSSGAQFNPAYAKRFIELLGEKKIRAL